MFVQHRLALVHASQTRLWRFHKAVILRVAFFAADGPTQSLAASAASAASAAPASA